MSREYSEADIARVRDYCLDRFHEAKALGDVKTAESYYEGWKSAQAKLQEVQFERGGKGFIDKEDRAYLNDLQKQREYWQEQQKVARERGSPQDISFAYQGENEIIRQQVEHKAFDGWTKERAILEAKERQEQQDRQNER